MTFVKLGIKFSYTNKHWLGEYNFSGTRIWDSARLLHPKMYRRGQLQCLSFGNGKPIDNKRGGAVNFFDKQHGKWFREQIDENGRISTYEQFRYEQSDPYVRNRYGDFPILPVGTDLDNNVITMISDNYSHTKEEKNILSKMA